MYENQFAAIQNLRKADIIYPGGLCTILFVKIEDVEGWPAADPDNGSLVSNLILKEGAVFYTCQASEKDRYYKEELKNSTPGDYHDIKVNGRMAGNTLENILTRAGMKYHQWILIVKDRDYSIRMIGNEDAGAKFFYNYDSGDRASSRGADVWWQWQHQQTPPIYNATGIVIDDTVIPVIPPPGGGTPPGTVYTLLQRFMVGQPGAPMADGSLTYTNAVLAGKRVLVFVGNGLKIPEFVTGITLERYITKNLSDDFITFNGGVTLNEIIEIYTYEQV